MVEGILVSRRLKAAPFSDNTVCRTVAYSGIWA